MKKRKFATFVRVILILVAWPSWADQLTYGKYFGTIQMTGTSEVMAVSLDAFITQIVDPTVFPELNVIIRTNLGGYFSSEYVGFHYYDPTFNFEKSTLQLNDAKNELTATLQVTNTDVQTILEGPVTHRPTNSKGTMRVVMNIDGSQPTMPKSPVISVLSGEYLGTCGKDKANLQIETGRGLGDSSPGNALAGFSITGRLGFTNGPLCDRGVGQYCSEFPLSKGSYFLFNGRLTMQGPLATLDCAKSGDSLQCNLQGQDRVQACKLSKKQTASTAPIQIPAGIFLDVPASQKMPLPDPLPPNNDDLVNALNGDFYGYLHYENRDIYQLMQMSIVATTSTDNSHIQNQVNVEPTVSLRLGSSWNSTATYSTLFPQRVFYLNPGFAFQADDNDNFMVIENWQMGFVSGVWYSRSYGRVGTFELQKGTPANVPAGMIFLPNCTGQFVGPADAPASVKNMWSIDVAPPNQPSLPQQLGVQLLARYSLRNPASSVQMFDAASVDLNTGAVAFLIKKSIGDRLVTGNLVSDDKLNLLWPVGPALGAPMSAYGTYTYKTGN